MSKIVAQCIKSNTEKKMWIQMVLLKEFFEKVNFENKSTEDKKHTLPIFWFMKETRIMSMCIFNISLDYKAAK